MSEWKRYLQTAFARPTETDRTRLEVLAGARLPDRYWQVVCEHQGQVLDTDGLVLPDEGEINFGVLLLALAPKSLSKSDASYTVEDCYRSMEDRYPAGLFPFADDTGGNYWAFDFRADPANPAVVFVDHEESGADGVTLAADSFAAFMALAGQPQDE
ncbi:SMI1/KNR4 family protein [Methylobacterium brachythecii]|uniref:Knr4/Smi1-like domain-containing protein n=1 Tax=Methylobacterium brachythecii TaxID=1176177 RepID=A0A7W6AMD9_9HYPH|nr:SMI1/KNR4 family protein [Methylobacterium brachythecii]MBB3903884.1 hypothetical protein [Methylobacterium brachythecii]GLS42633.1 hypothetical protein GCM10007884_06180 [Methylobacterium brachythecii]